MSRVINNLQPLHDYTVMIIRDHVDKLHPDVGGDIDTLAKIVINYGKKLGYERVNNGSSMKLRNDVYLVIDQIRSTMRLSGEMFNRVTIKKTSERLNGK